MWMCVLLCMCWLWVDTAGKGVSFGRFVWYPTIHSLFVLSAQWGNALGGVGIVGRVGKHRPPRVISFHLALSLALKKAHTHMDTVQKCIYCIFKETASPPCWHSHRCCHTLELESRRGGYGGERSKHREQEREGERESGDNVNSSAPNTVSWNPELSSEAHREQTKRSSFDRETSSDSAKAWNLATKHKLQMATRGI